MESDQDLYQQALREHALELGIDLDEDPEFYKIVEESLVAPLPEGWIQLKEVEGEYAGSLYYYHEISGQSQWEHPSDHYYRRQYQQEKAAKTSKANPYSAEAWGYSGIASPKKPGSRSQATPHDEDADLIDADNGKELTNKVVSLKSQLEAMKQESIQKDEKYNQLRTELTRTEQSVKTSEEKYENLLEKARKSDEMICSLEQELKRSIEGGANTMAKDLSIVREKLEEDTQKMCKTFEEQKLKPEEDVLSLKTELLQLSDSVGSQDKIQQSNLKILDDQVRKYKDKVAAMKVDKKKHEEIMKQMHHELKFALEKGESLHSELVLAREQAQEAQAADAIKLGDSRDRVMQLEEELKATLLEVKASKEAETRAVELHKEWKEKYLHERHLRQELGRKLMDLQGNIFVICRVRPLLRNEIDPCVEVIDSEQLFVDGISHNFNAVFDSDSSQDKVYAEVQPSALSVLEGYNVCIFAYGQTGSGKTYTMEGVPGNRGVNHRALSGLFESAAASPDTTFEFSLSMLEVYNENIKDLLGDDQSTNLDIRLGNDGSGSLSVYVENLIECGVSSLEEVEEIMKQGFASRTVGSNNVNEHSSRSHLVLCIKVAATRRGSRVITHGKLNLVDLAGSERLKNTNAEGPRLKEAQNINKSLSALGDVISALGRPPRKDSHVPYRNSKLTFLLQDSLAANSRVLMFVNIGPSQASSHESQCSLKFAGRCRAVQLGTVKKSAKKKH